MKKLTSVILAFLIVFAALVPAFAAEEPQDIQQTQEVYGSQDIQTAEEAKEPDAADEAGESAEPEKPVKTGPLTYLVIGDSIARGAGIVNSEEACYGRIVADTNGYNYINRGIDGYTTEKLDKELDLPEVIADVAKADIIDISIGGNDYLYSNIIELIFALLLGSTAPANKIIDNAYKNFKSIISKIKTINPDAVIIVQTLYNPNHPLISSVLEKFVSMLNEMFTRYLEENPGAYYIADVHEALKGQIGFIALDTIHPNARGNVIIAKVLLKLLKELDLGKTETPVINHQGVSELFGPIWSILQFVKKFA